VQGELRGQGEHSRVEFKAHLDLLRNMVWAELTARYRTTTLSHRENRAVVPRARTIRAAGVAPFPSSLTPTFTMPAAFIVYLLSLLVDRSALYLCPAVAYAVLLMFFSILEATRLGRLSSVFLFLIMFPACHLSYGAGFLFQMLGSLRLSTPTELVQRASEK
jgi:hypothetical protein